MTSFENRIRIMLVDDHPLLREGVAAVVERQNDMRLVAEEVVTNVAKYAYAPSAAAAMEVRVSMGDDAVSLEFRDRGRPFDPLGQPPPDLDAPLEERPVGGLGLTLVRALVEEARYAREDTVNVLRLVKRRTRQ